MRVAVRDTAYTWVVSSLACAKSFQVSGKMSLGAGEGIEVQ